MTETQWLHSVTPFPILVFLQGGEAAGQVLVYREGRTLSEGPSLRITSEQLRQFAGACCQRLTATGLNEVSQRALAVFLRYTRDELSRDEARIDLTLLERLSAERHEKISVWSAIAGFRRDDAASAADCASHAVWSMAWGQTHERLIEAYDVHDEDDLFMWGFEGPPDPVWRAACAAEERAQADLLREITGNPFHPVEIQTGWLDWNNGAIVELAAQIRATDAFDLLPILADALEEAGCTDAELLGHCRGTTPHVRGCWAAAAIPSRRDPT